jgi:DNA-binding MarR family transcriptional regulator
MSERPRSGLRSTGVLSWLRLARVFKSIERAASEHLRASGLSVAQFDVLAQVGASEGCTQQALADHLLVTKGNVTQLLDRMEEAGLLTRHQQGRTKRVCLTDAGREVRERVITSHERLVEQQFAALTPDEQHQLLALLRRLDRTLERQAPLP